MRDAYKKVCKIHERLPDGGILVFVTSQQEIGWMCRKLKKRFSANQNAAKKGKEGKYGWAWKVWSIPCSANV
jgi:ATP-dependent RNA helicase DHX37/DHR1